MVHKFGVLKATVLCLALVATGLRADEPVRAGKPVTLRVTLPEEDATLTIDGKDTKQSGSLRVFESPPLPNDKPHTYTLVAVWEPNNYTTITRTHKVVVRGGDTVEVDFRKANPKLADNIVVRYVPTPQEVVEEMLKLGKVGKDDIVFDLGCGDGRIVVTAVAKYQAKRGVGVDLDPDRIKESKENAQENKVADKVEFRQENVLKLKDISEATIVMLYMGDDLNLALRPILQRSLKPGSRIVSHRFLMGDWKPDKTITVTDKEGEEYELHLWTIKEKN